MEIVLVIVCTAILFVGMILLLAAKPKYAGKITGTFITTVAVGGLLLYGYGFAVTSDNLLLAIIRALLAVCGMYVGKNDLSAISGAPLMQHSWMHVAFWILHLLALYATASAAITTVGAEALKKLRLWLARRGQMNLIYGIHDDSLSLGKQLIRRKKSVVVFVDAKPSAGHTAAIASAGCVLRSDGNALAADVRFLRTIGIGTKRDLVLYALSKDAVGNISYAQNLLRSLQKRDVAPERTRLVILGKDEETIRALQVHENSYGFGYVSVVEEAELAARLLIHECPPCDTMRFNAVGEAQEDFEALVVGFGQTGQAVLKQLLMHGQFEGSRFHATVFAPDFDKTHGFFSKQFAGLLKAYDIRFCSYDGRSSKMYDYLDARGEKIKYVAICTGNEKLNRELAEELHAYFCQLGRYVPVCQCAKDGIKILNGNDHLEQHACLYDAQLLSRDGLDQMAMILNHRYQVEMDKTMLETWMECDYFSRQSCRASADFAGAMLRMAGISAEEAVAGWQPTGQLLLNLSKTEHLRWNAFHYCMGFTAMTDEEFNQRAAQYRDQMENQGKASIRITKNMVARTHACLVDWDDLELLAEKEYEVTGKYTDYQQLDAENVLALPALMCAARDHEVCR